MQRRWVAVLLALIAALSSSAVYAQDRALRGVALVIGQSAYETLAPLPNPQNDARAVDEMLDGLGFEVDTVRDGDHRRLIRALERFVEDAADADVALLYYSGHGIEAGGENFLVPVEADPTSLNDAVGALVPLSTLMDELRAAVPVTIVLLDACRDNPFPAHATVRLSPDAAPVPVSSAGLSVPRGASSLAAVRAKTPGPDNLGSVIGFAAAPGAVALDGEPGGNSPYAAALIKHLAAGDYPFGDVMTMVAQEVWLTTRAAQIPWTNTSLRRQLSFGGVVKTGDVDEELIRGERRRLLLTISELGEAERRQVASRAEEGRVPMDALFAMLSAVGAEVPQEPDELDRLLREQAERLRAMLDERAALATSDPEILRLASLSDRAVREGALQAAIVLNERAKTRISELSLRIDDAEAQIAARRTEFAAVFEKSAQTYALAGDHAAAARDYAAAFDQVERWDRDLAWRYKFGEAEALMQQGHYRSDFAAQDSSIAAFERAGQFTEGRAADHARTQGGLAFALWARADRTGLDQDAERALDILRDAAARIEPSQHPQIWAELQGRLGSILIGLGWRRTGTKQLDEGTEAIRKALTVQTREANPTEWSRQQNRLGAGLYMIALREPGTERLVEAIRELESGLEARPRARVPLDWAQTETNRVLALMTLGLRNGNMEVLSAAEAGAREVAKVYDRERTPMLWAEAVANHGSALWQLAVHDTHTDRAVEAASAFRSALEVIPREASPLRWAGLQDNLALALKTIGERRNDEVMVEEAIAHYRFALEERRRERTPLEWASTSNNLANTLMALGYAQGSVGMLEEAVTLFRAVLEVNRRDEIPLEWARSTNNLALALYSLAHAEMKLGTTDGARMRLDEAIVQFGLALQENRRDRVPLDFGTTHYNLAKALLDRGRLDHDRAFLDEAKASVAAARAAYQGAGMTRYAGTFDNLELEISIADLQAQVQERIREVEAEASKKQ